MNDPAGGGKPNNTTQFSVIANNRKVKDLYQSLQYLQLQNPPNNMCENQPQYERQHGMQNNLSGHSAEASGGDRRIPRVAPTAKTAFALENIRRDLKDFPTSNYATMEYRQNSSDSDSSKNDFKSNSFTDIPSMHHNHHYVNYPAKLQPFEQKKLNILTSYGFDEVKLLIYIKTLNILLMREGSPIVHIM